MSNNPPDPGHRSSRRAKTGHGRSSSRWVGWQAPAYPIHGFRTMARTIRGTDLFKGRRWLAEDWAGFLDAAGREL